MAIPESQLSRLVSPRTPGSFYSHTSSNKIATGSALMASRNDIRRFSSRFLSLPDTNIRGDSDVDLVAQLTSAFLHDASLLSQFEQNQLDATFQPAMYGWDDFRREARRALVSWFGNSLVNQGNKSIKIQADPPKLAADVVVCMEYQRYLDSYSYVEGITFWALRDMNQIINYPKELLQEWCGQSVSTLDRYKRLCECSRTPAISWSPMAKLVLLLPHLISLNLSSTTRLMRHFKMDFRTLTAQLSIGLLQGPILMGSFARMASNACSGRLLSSGQYRTLRLS